LKIRPVELSEYSEIVTGQNSEYLENKTGKNSEYSENRPGKFSEFSKNLKKSYARIFRKFKIFRLLQLVHTSNFCPEIVRIFK